MMVYTILSAPSQAVEPIILSMFYGLYDHLSFVHYLAITLQNEIKRLPEVDSMSDYDIRQSLLASKDWKRDMKSLQTLKESLDVDMVSIDVDELLVNQFQTSYDNMVKDVTGMMEKLAVADKDLGLFSLSDSKSKTIVQYPDSFGGGLGENVFRFIKDFKDAIQSDHVRKADEVKTLIKHLKGDTPLF